MSRVSIEVHLPLFLLWLDDQQREHRGEYADVASYADVEDLDTGFVANLASILEEQGFVDAVSGLGAGPPDCLITAAGKVEAQRLRERRGNPVNRLQYARNTLITWLFNQHRATGAYAEIFYTSPESVFLGDLLTVDETIETADYLAERGLITISYEAGHGLHMRLTADGQDCEMSGVSVSDYVSGKAGGGDTYHVTGAQGAVIGGRQNTVTQIRPTLGLTETEDAELVEAAGELENAAIATAPDQGRLRRAADRVKGTLTSASQVTGALTVLIQQGKQAYRAVFGG